MKSIEPSRRYCCGCKNRVATLAAGVWLLFSAQVYFSMAVVELYSEELLINPSLSDEFHVELRRINLLAVIVSIFQMFVAILIIYGVCKHQLLSIQVSLVLVSAIVLLLCAIVSIKFNPGVAIYAIIQITFVWYPLYGYTKEYPHHRIIPPEIIEMRPIEDDDDISIDSDLDDDVGSSSNSVGGYKHKGYRIGNGSCL